MRRCNVLILMLLFVNLCSAALAYDEKKAHPQITEAAINNSKLSDYLKTNLGLSDGIRTTYSGITILNSLQSGSMNEDLSSRGLNHFWNPLVHTLRGNWGRVHIKARWPV